MAVFGVVDRIDVRAAWKNDAVEAFENPAQRLDLERWDEDG